MLTAALISGVGGALTIQDASAETTTTSTKALTSVFAAKDNAKLSVQDYGTGEDATKVAAYALSNGGSVVLKRNLALKWHDDNLGAKYLSVKFSLKDLKFTKLTLSMDTPSAWATDDDKSTNFVDFTVEGEKLYAAVNGGEKKQEIVNKTGVLTFAMKETGVDGEFAVAITEEGGTKNFDLLDKFTNVGANYAVYTTNKNYPLSFKAETAKKSDNTYEETIVCIHEINGQKFTGVDTDNKVKDTAAPILVVNTEFDGFLLGTKFSWSESDGDYKVIDVLQDSKLTTDLKFYQYNPNDEKPEAGKEKELYKTLKESTVFQSETYKLEDETYTTVYNTYGKEYVSIYFEIGDDTFSATSDAAENAKKLYHLSWYAAEGGKGDIRKENAIVTEGTAIVPVAGGEWIYLNRNEVAPKYKNIKEVKEVAKEDGKGTEWVNVLYAEDSVEGIAYQTALQTFKDTLNKQAAEKYASNEELQIPSVRWLLDDNNGYRSMQFSISYYTPTSSVGSPSSLTSKDFDELEIPVESEGWYSFKIFATDAAGNAMEYADNEGNKVTLTTDNVWDIDDIPTFTFKIGDKGLKVEELSSSKLKETEILNTTFTLPSSEMKVIGATDLQKSYALYRIDLTKYSDLTVDTLTKVTFEEIATAVANKGFSSVSGGDYHKYYLRVYAELLADKLGKTETADVDNILKCFVKVGEAGDTVNNATDEWEEYNWNATSVSFKTAKTGEYLLLGDFWEKNMPTYRAGAYKLIVVESKAYSVTGEDNWLEDNIVSVILFAIAGVMLILIIILLMVKPSDETLEDVDAKAEKKAKKKAKKADKEEQQD